MDASEPNNEATLLIAGVPLTQSPIPSPELLKACERAQLIFVESKKVAHRMLKIRDDSDERIFALDPLDRHREKELGERLSQIAKSKQTVVLMSDCGMPLLFDPGKIVYDRCRKLNFRIRTLSGATSWATACVLSGWSPPFFIHGFLPVKAEERKTALHHLKSVPGNIVLLETPYRFLTLLEELNAWESKRNLFLAWNLDSPDMRLLWGKASEFIQYAKEKKMVKGEFVIVLEQT